MFHRSKRPVEPEAVFGQIKANKQYDRFRHFKEDKIKMDFAIFAIAFNIGKLHNNAQNKSKMKKKSSLFEKWSVILRVVIFGTTQNYYQQKLDSNSYKCAA